MKKYGDAWSKAFKQEDDAKKMIDAIDEANSLYEAGDYEEANKRLESYFEERSAIFKKASDYEKEQRTQAISDLGEQLLSEMEAYQTATISGSQNMIDLSLTYVQKAADELEKAGVKIPEGLIEGIKSGEISVEEAMRTISELIEENSKTDLTVEGAETAETYQQGMASRQEAIISTADSMASAGVSAMGSQSIRTKAENAGKAIGEGFKVGLNSKKKAIISASIGIVSAAFLAMKKEANINSPSKKSRDLIGKPIGEGIGVGIATETPSVAKRAAASTNSIINRMQPKASQIEAIRRNYSYAVKKFNEPRQISANDISLDTLKTILIGGSRPNVTVNNNNTFNNATARDGEALLRQLDRALGVNL